MPRVRIVDGQPDIRELVRMTPGMDRIEAFEVDDDGSDASGLAVLRPAARKRQ